jgi:hypothetical protein
MVEELKMRVNRCQAFAAPIDHPLVRVDPDVTARPRILLEELTGDTTAAASEVEHRLVSIEGDAEVSVDRGTARVVERPRIFRADQAEQFRRRQR